MEQWERRWQRLPETTRFGVKYYVYRFEFKGRWASSFYLTVTQFTTVDRALCVSHQLKIAIVQVDSVPNYKADIPLHEIIWYKPVFFENVHNQDWNWINITAA